MPAWRYGSWQADHPLPIGMAERAPVGKRVNAGDVIAAGVTLATAARIAAARRLRLAPTDLERELRVRVGSDVTAGTLLARTSRRFARPLVAPIDGRMLHVSADGEIYIAPIVSRWVVRSTLDGEVTRSDDAVVSVEGEAWAVAGVAAYGPDAIGDLALAVEGPTGDLAPSRLDVRLGGRILIGGSRVSAEVMTRAHACGIAGLIAGAAPAAGLRVVYGDTVTASGTAGRDDRPTVICLMGFGSAVLPREVFGPLVGLSGSRAAIHTASARLFVFAPADAGDFASGGRDLVLAGDFGGVRAVEGCEDAGVADLPSELRARAMRCGAELVPAANIRPADAER